MLPAQRDRARSRGGATQYISQISLKLFNFGLTSLRQWTSLGWNVFAVHGRNLCALSGLVALSYQGD